MSDLKAVAIFAAFLLGLSACGGADPTSPSNDIAPNPPSIGPGDPTGSETVSFSTDVVPIFGSGGCTASGCHGRPFQADLQLTPDAAWVRLVNFTTVMEPQSTRVIPGDPNNSYLVTKLEGRQRIGARMPAMRGPIPQSEIDIIRKWIEEGARNN